MRANTKRSSQLPNKKRRRAQAPTSTCDGLGSWRVETKPELTVRGHGQAAVSGLVVNFAPTTTPNTQPRPTSSRAACPLLLRSPRKGRLRFATDTTCKDEPFGSGTHLSGAGIIWHITIPPVSTMKRINPINDDQRIKVT
jgi:hypothetical protein